MVINTNGTAKEPLSENGKVTKGSVENTPLKPAEQKTSSSKAEEQKSTLAIVPVQQKTTIQARLKKLESLNQLLERRVLLSDALDDVNSFVLAPNAPASIRFSDSKNNTFSISNQLVISDMIELAKKRLESELDKVDALIIF